MRPVTKDGNEAMRWSGHGVSVAQFALFTACRAKIESPGNELTVRTRGGLVLAVVEIGQWLVVKGPELFEVVDNDKIVFDESKMWLQMVKKGGEG